MIVDVSTGSSVHTLNAAIDTMGDRLASCPESRLSGTLGPE